MLLAALEALLFAVYSFNGHPPLGVNATNNPRNTTQYYTRFNGHPPLGVNATSLGNVSHFISRNGFNGHPPLGVNATGGRLDHLPRVLGVSMGTHPWG